MLTEKRQEEIVRLVYERESITVAELKEILHSSESTIRRDIIALDQEGRLTKVFGGAIALRTAQIVNKELSMVQKKESPDCRKTGDRALCRVADRAGRLRLSGRRNIDRLDDRIYSRNAGNLCDERAVPCKAARG